ncbi:MAG: metallophosphoesterase [Caldimicrobium sp.]|nr:metallophosphoesterase [Caldimicrobium sp.]MDW8094597.1 metallophosphoesterase [Caldimicrobium sp.]
MYFLWHLYLYRRIKGNYPYLPLLLILGFISPLFIRISDLYLPPSLAFIISFAALFWMGFLFYFVVLDLILRFFLKSVFFSLSLALVLSLYSYVETLHPELIHVILYSPKIPPATTIKILHFSDVHLGPVMGMDKVRFIEKAVQKYKPDLIISTGDFVDGNMKNKAFLQEALSRLEAPLGKYAVVGNHEYYRGIEKSIEFTTQAGFQVLRGESKEILPFLLMVGLDDDDCKYFMACKGPLKESLLLRTLPSDKFILLLKHKPRIEPEALGFFDLMLSGHTHGGLYYPIGKWLLKALSKFEYPGWHSLVPQGYLFVSKGLGTGGPPMRLFSPPDLALIEIRAGQRAYQLFRQGLGD